MHTPANISQPFPLQGNIASDRCRFQKPGIWELCNSSVFILLTVGFTVHSSVDWQPDCCNVSDMAVAYLPSDRLDEVDSGCSSLSMTSLVGAI